MSRGAPTESPGPADRASGSSAGSDRGGRRLCSVAAFVIGVVLFGSAVWAVVRDAGTIGAVFATVRSSSPWLIVLALVLPLVNLALISVFFWMLTRRYGRVGAFEMGALIGSAWVLNYLPLKPGMFGRLAYHKRVNNIRYKDSARVLGWSAVTTAIGVALMFGGAVAALLVGSGDWLWIGLPVALASAAGVLMRASRFGRSWSWLAVAVVLRYADALVWTLRYWVVFTIAGLEMPVSAAAFATVVSQVSISIPLTGNGLGVREWAVGLLVTLGYSAGDAGVGAGVGEALVPDLLNRAAELLVSVPVGLACYVFVARRLMRHPDDGVPDQTAGGDPADTVSSDV